MTEEIEVGDRRLLRWHLLTANNRGDCNRHTTVQVLA